MKNKKVKILLGCLVAVVAVFAYMAATGLIVVDHSAERGFENSIIWKGVKYESVSGKYNEGKTIAKVKDSGLSINEVEGDDSHTFVVVRSFIDQWLVVREDYNIPKSGKITKAYWSYQFIEDEKFLNAITEMITKVKPDFEYDTEDREIFEYTDNQNMKELYIAYEDCPVPTIYLGYMGVIDGEWYLTVGKGNDTKIYCYTIPDEYSDVFDEYLS